jgi:hypothetical protein
MSMLGILITMVVAALLLLVEHWFPWSKVVARPLHQTVNYMMGLAAILVPLTVLFGVWERWTEVLALWVVAAGGGLGVMAAYAFDGWMAARARAKAAELEASMLRPEVENVQTER